MHCFAFKGNILSADKNLRSCLPEAIQTPNKKAPLNELAGL
jgi:hypothetical protein